MKTIQLQTDKMIDIKVFMSIITWDQVLVNDKIQLPDGLSNVIGFLPCFRKRDKALYYFPESTFQSIENH